MEDLIFKYKNDKEGVYQTWFINNNDRLKAFRSIKNGIRKVVEDIKKENFPNTLENTSLEFVLKCISEQKEIFKGAKHPFDWKPKMRIPDIYENQENKKYFGQFLENCLNTTNEKKLLAEITYLSEKNIKGLGPSLANILYFLHPTVFPPCNTAIKQGFYYLFGEKIGCSWLDYLKMREVIVQKNEENKRYLSSDLGAYTGLLYEIGKNNIFVGQEKFLSSEDRKKISLSIKKRHIKNIYEKDEEDLHTKLQYQLLKIGHNLGYDVIAASNDKSKSYNDTNFSFLCLSNFPKLDTSKEICKTISLIDLIWFEKGTNKIVCAFEVEKSTSIYSGILRLTDLSVSLPSNSSKLYIIIPNKREIDLLLQLNRPSIQKNGCEILYILSSDIIENCEYLCKLGDNCSILEKIAKKL